MLYIPTLLSSKIHVQIYLSKHYTLNLNVFKVNYKDTKTTSVDVMLLFLMLRGDIHTNVVIPSVSMTLREVRF